MNGLLFRHWKTILLVLIVAGLLFLALSGYLSPSIKFAVNPLIGLQRWFSLRYTTVYQFFTIPREVVVIQQRNEELENEVARLQTEIIELQQQLREAQVLYALLDFARARPENQYIASSVIGRDPSPFLHYVIIDHGSDDGIRHGMPVVTERGLVGKVEAVTAGASRVQLLTDPGFSVNVRIQPAEEYAVVQGSLTGDISLEMVPQDITLQSGDLILTSGLGSEFPQDVLIGQVVTVRKQETGLFQSASVQPTVDFSSLRAVLVIVNFNPVDVTPLESETIQ